MSAIVGGVIGTIVGFLLAQGFTGIKTQADKIGNTIISGSRPDGTPFNIKIKNDALLSPQFDIVKVSSSYTTRNDNNPAYKLKNDSSVIKRILHISFIPDALMQSEGLMEIHINNNRFFPITDPTQGQFIEDVDGFTIPIPETFGIKILPKEKLELFLWNPSGNSVSGTFAVFIAELP